MPKIQMKYLPALFIFSLFFGILFLLNNFFAHQFALFLNLENIGQVRLVSWAITLFTLFGLPMSVNSKSRIGQAVYLTSSTLLGLILYLFLSFFLLNILQYAVAIPPFYGGLAALSIAVLTVIYGIWSAFNIRITKLEIPIKGLTRDVKAVHLTDIHLGHARGKRFLQEVVDKTNAQSPEVVFVTGDLFDGRINLTQDELTPFAALQAPVFFIEGNHDNSSGVQTIKGFLKNLGVHVLDNQIAHWKEFQIIGLNHMLADDSRFSVHTIGKFATIKTVLAELNIQQNKPTILLHHSPDGIKYAAQHGVDLYLTGHTHAGQLFPINYLAARMFDYNRGLHEYENTKIFVSEGIGTFGPPMRIGTKSEIISLMLKASI
jgi:uncharacterized protein